MISLIDFTHSFPLIEALSSQTKMSRGSPGENLIGVLDGKYSMAMVSLVSYLENKDDLYLVKGANIHTKAQTLSTLLVSREKDLNNQMGIAVTAHTRTTELYMDLVLSRMGISPKKIYSKSTEASELLEEAEYALVIGDEALRYFQGNGKIILDIGYEVSHFFKLEPLYAVTVARKDSVDMEEARILEESLKLSGNFILESIEKGSVERGISRDILEYYYKLISYGYSMQQDRTLDFVRYMLEPIKH
ncbi:ABC transporter substrate-binding protein [Oxyplasma meridianum]|uniref:ABC transporter substrate-binding protein n=1 Tax=Oxyplasma meridianum TaxID=3073602 RepID=A0AAX4NH86_9ARCH